MKLVVHDGFGIWCAARRLNQGRFVWPGAASGAVPALMQAQFEALVLELPWQHLQGELEHAVAQGYRWRQGISTEAWHAAMQQL